MRTRQNTNTPGLNGEDRREELIRRLIAAVESANMTGTFVEELETRAADGQPQPRGQVSQPRSFAPSQRALNGLLLSGRCQLQ